MGREKGAEGLFSIVFRSKRKSADKDTQPMAGMLRYYFTAYSHMWYHHRQTVDCTIHIYSRNIKIIDVDLINSYRKRSIHQLVRKRRVPCSFV